MAGRSRHVEEVLGHGGHAAARPPDRPPGYRCRPCRPAALPAPGAVGRRRFLATAAGATAALLVTDRIPGAWAVPRAATDDPFTLGVASGDPTPTGVVLWTRLAPRPLDPDGGMTARPVPVD